MSEDETIQEKEKLEFSEADAANTLPNENPADDPKTSFPEPEISPMEVHHHPHAQHKKNGRTMCLNFYFYS